MANMLKTILLHTGFSSFACKTRGQNNKNYILQDYLIK